MVKIKLSAKSASIECLAGKTYVRIDVHFISYCLGFDVEVLTETTQTFIQDRHIRIDVTTYLPRETADLVETCNHSCQHHQ